MANSDELLMMIRDNPEVIIKELVTLAGMTAGVSSESNIRRKVNKLVQYGLVKVVKVPSDKWRAEVNGYVVV